MLGQVAGSGHARHGPLPCEVQWIDRYEPKQTSSAFPLNAGWYRGRRCSSGCPLRARRHELNRLDALDAALRPLARAADYSRLWLAASAQLAALGGERGRRAAENGLGSIALASAVVNLVLKPLGNRRRPDRDTHDVPVTRQVTITAVRGPSRSGMPTASVARLGPPAGR
jgi:hypothetical protein